MRLYLIRHGETVDNAAGLYAGTRDSALTVHGVLQARQLAEYFKTTRPGISHIFASPSQRAHKTALAILTSQNVDIKPASADTDVPNTDASRCDITLAKDLMEQDFGFYEGKPFIARSQGSTKFGRQAHADTHSDTPGFVDVESKASIDQRSIRFIDQHLEKLILDHQHEETYSVAIVAHGILLSHLWRCFLRQLPLQSVSIAKDVLGSRGDITLERLGGFSNTGFLELSIDPTRPDDAVTVDVSAELQEQTHVESDFVQDTAAKQEGLQGLTTVVLTVNGQQHLQGVKRARGGIGRMKFDEGQKTLDTFFKKPKKS